MTDNHLVLTDKVHVEPVVVVGAAAVVVGAAAVVVGAAAVVGTAVDVAVEEDTANFD